MLECKEEIYVKLWFEIYFAIYFTRLKLWGWGIYMIYTVSLKRIVDDTYDVEIGSNLIDKLVLDLKNWNLGKKISKYAIITDTIVKDLYANRIYQKLIENGFKTDLFVFEAGEKSKTRKTKEIIEDAMLAKGYRRDSCIIAVGGGVVTDLAGFIAGTFARGIPFINYATTLLAAADASIGGKTAVDTPLATNLIGLFNQPEKVYIDVNSWGSLPRRQLSSGLAETIKHACLADKDFFEFLDKNVEKVFQLDKDVCKQIARENCRIKYEVVMKDERESGLREILNLGHTVGRAIETISEYKLLHGEALSIGLVAEVNLAYEMGDVSDEEKERVIDLLKKAELPVEIPSYINKEELIKKLYTDKKVKKGELHFVIQKGIGSIVEFENSGFSTPVKENMIRKILEKI